MPKLLEHLRALSVKSVWSWLMTRSQKRKQAELERQQAELEAQTLGVLIDEYQEGLKVYRSLSRQKRRSKAGRNLERALFEHRGKIKMMEQLVRPQAAKP